MIVAELSLKDIVGKYSEANDSTLEELARKADLSWSQFHTVVQRTGFSDGTRLGTVKKIATALGMPAWKLLKLLEEE